MMMLIEDGVEFKYIIRHLEGWVYEYIIRNFGRGRGINTDLRI